MRTHLFYLICLRHLIRSIAITNRIFLGAFCFHACVTCSELPSDMSTMLSIGIRVQIRIYDPESNNGTPSIWIRNIVDHPSWFAELRIRILLRKILGSGSSFIKASDTYSFRFPSKESSPNIHLLMNVFPMRL